MNVFETEDSKGEREKALKKEKQTDRQKNLALSGPTIIIQSDPDLTAPDLAAPRFNGRIDFPQKFFRNFPIFEFSN